MPVYFRGPDALITHLVFTSQHPHPRTFAISELQDPHIVIADTSRRHSYEVHAFYRGQRVCLFRTPDERLFGQIRRALIRALEAYADGRCVPGRRW